MSLVLALLLNSCTPGEGDEAVLSGTTEIVEVEEVASTRKQEAKAVASSLETPGIRGPVQEPPNVRQAYLKELPHIADWASRYALLGNATCEAQLKWEDGQCAQYYNIEDPLYPDVAGLAYSIGFEHKPEQKDDTILSWGVHMPVDHRSCSVQWTETISALQLKREMKIHCLDAEVYRRSTTLPYFPTIDFAIPEFTAVEERPVGQPLERDLFNLWFPDHKANE